MSNPFRTETRLLEDCDSEASDLIAELESQVVNTELAQPMRAIGERIDEFEFDEALELLNAFRDAMKFQTTDSVASS